MSLQDVSDRLRSVLAQVNALAAQVGATSGAAPVQPGPAAAAPGFVVPGRMANGSQLPQPGETGSGIQVPNAADKPVVDQMLAKLGASPTGASIIAELQRTGVRVAVADDAQLAATGHGESGAYFDPTSDTIMLRRSTLQTDLGKAAAVFGHEATHALDDHGGVGKAWSEQRLQQLAAAGQATPQAVEQVRVDLSLAREARAFTIHAQLMRELAVNPEGILADVVRTGANDQATYGKIFSMLVQAGPAGGYNTTGAQTAPFAL